MTDISQLLLPYQKTFVRNRSRIKFWISSRQVGKSFAVAYMLCRKALTRRNAAGLCVSTGQRAASELLRKCVQFAEAVKILTDGAVSYESSYDTLKFSNGSRIMSLPNNPNAARGVTADIIAIDEAAFLERFDDMLQAIVPTLTRRADSELVVTTTPAGRNGPFYDFFTSHQEDAYIQYTTIEDAVKDGLKVDVSELRKMCPDEDVFNQEYMCCFSSSSGQVIDANLIKSQEKRPACSCWFLGMDVGRKNDNTAITVIGMSEGKAWLDDLITLRDVPYSEQMQTVARLNQKYCFAGGYVDAGGIGSPIAEEITRTVNSKIKGIQFTQQNKTEMTENFRSLALDGKLVFCLPEEKAATVREDIRGTVKIITDSGTVKYASKRDSSGHCDSFSSLILGLRAFSETLSRGSAYSVPKSFFLKSRL